MKLAQSYQAAREEFLSLCQEKELYVESYVMPDSLGINGEELAIDVAFYGRFSANRCLLVSSAVHGIEGYCGSAVQCALLRSDFLDSCPENTAVVFVHGLNPYGFSYGRRVNEDNIDLNRNFADFSLTPAVNEAFLNMAREVFPESWQGSDLEAIHQNVERYMAEHGKTNFQAAMMGGQYDRADCTFYGGVAESWSRDNWHHIVKSLSVRYKFVVHLDIHTGLGEAGECEVIYAGRPDEAVVALAQAWFGDVFVPGSAQSNAEAIQGNLGQYLDEQGISNVSVALEFGTQPFEKVARALIDDNWLGFNPHCDAELRSKISRRLRAAFAIDHPAWEAEVWQLALKHCKRAVRGLGGVSLG